MWLGQARTSRCRRRPRCPPERGPVSGSAPEAIMACRSTLVSPIRPADPIRPAVCQRCALWNRAARCSPGLPWLGGGPENGAPPRGGRPLCPRRRSFRPLGSEWVGRGLWTRGGQDRVTGVDTSSKKSPPLSSTTMNAGKFSTSIFQTASMPSSGYSRVSTLRMQSWARIAAGPPTDPR